MKKVLVAFITVAFAFGMVGLARADLISFLNEDSFAGVDGSTSGWSTNDSMVQLSTSSWSLLGGTASVDGYINGHGLLTQRGTRGLGINGNEPDEVDYGTGRPERIEITFDTNSWVNSLEVRSLFIEGGGTQTEQGAVEFYLDGSLVHTQSLIAVQSGGNGVLAYNTPHLADRLKFYVPQGQSYTNYSEFAVARLDVEAAAVPEPGTLLLLGTGLIGLAGYGKRFGRKKKK